MSITKNNTRMLEGSISDSQLESGVGISANNLVKLDGSGNLLVGKTSNSSAFAGAMVYNSGRVFGTVSGDYCARFNRLLSDGDIVQFQKDGSKVGVIGSRSGIDIFISGNRGAGIKLTDQEVVPVDASGASRDDAIDVGHPSIRFDDVYATNGTIQTSDQNEKQDIEVLSEAEQRVAVACKGLLRKFRWKSSVEENGDDARIHFGIIAQDLKAAFEAEGLDAGRYAMFISSTWTDEDTGEEKTRLGVRYSELLAFIISAI